MNQHNLMFRRTPGFNSKIFAVTVNLARSAQYIEHMFFGDECCKSLFQLTENDFLVAFSESHDS